MNKHKILNKHLRLHLRNKHNILSRLLHFVFTFPNYFTNFIYHYNSISFILRINHNNFTCLNEISPLVTIIETG